MIGTKGTNAPLIKKYNRALIMAHIFETGTISRTELSKATGLSKGGLTPIINDLLDLHLIKEMISSQGKPGRKPLNLEINPDSCSMIAMDWTRNNFGVALVNPCGEILDKKLYTITYADTPYTIIKKIHKKKTRKRERGEIKFLLITYSKSFIRSKQEE